MDQTVYNTHEAKTHLSKLIARVEAGEEITIARAGIPAVKMVAADSLIAIRKRGDLRDQIWCADDWDSSETNAAIGGDFVDASIFPSEDDE